MLIQKQLLEKLIELASDSAEYLNEKWITVHPHGSDSKGVHVKVEDGETSKQAVERKFGDGEKKESFGKKQINFAKQFKSEEDFIQAYHKLREDVEKPFGSGSLSANTSKIYDAMNQLKNLGAEFELRKILSGNKQYYFLKDTLFGDRLDKFYQKAIKD